MSMHSKVINQLDDKSYINQKVAFFNVGKKVIIIALSLDLFTCFHYWPFSVCDLWYMRWADGSSWDYISTSL